MVGIWGDRSYRCSECDGWVLGHDIRHNGTGWICVECYEAAKERVMESTNVEVSFPQAWDSSLIRETPDEAVERFQNGVENLEEQIERTEQELKSLRGLREKFLNNANRIRKLQQDIALGNRQIRSYQTEAQNWITRVKRAEEELQRFLRVK